MKLSIYLFVKQRNRKRYHNSFCMQKTNNRCQVTEYILSSVNLLIMLKLNVNYQVRSL